MRNVCARQAIEYINHLFVQLEQFAKNFIFCTSGRISCKRGIERTKRKYLFNTLKTLTLTQ